MVSVLSGSIMNSYRGFRYCKTALRNQHIQVFQAWTENTGIGQSVSNCFMCLYTVLQGIHKRNVVADFKI